MSGEGWVEVCRVEEIPYRGGRLVRFAANEIALFRLGDGAVRAIDNRCPHKQGPLVEGIVTGKRVICPLHARAISLVSGEVQPPDRGCVKTYPVRVADGRVWIRL